MTNPDSKIYYDALQTRTDLYFPENKRLLYTTIATISAFDVPYKNTGLSLNILIREKLHTAIVVNHHKNTLKAMNGTFFPLPQNVDATNLTTAVIALIGGMFYGAEEVANLQRR